MGPTTVKEFLNFPKWLMKDLAEDIPHSKTFEANMRRGVLLGTAWSGYRGGEMVTEMLTKAWCREFAPEDLWDDHH